MVTKWILEKQQNNECTGIWCDGQMVSNDHNIYIYISAMIIYILYSYSYSTPFVSRMFSEQNESLGLELARNRIHGLPGPN
jgi:hypothetical protein